MPSVQRRVIDIVDGLAILVGTRGNDKITIGTRLEDLGLGIEKREELLWALEQEFDIEVPDHVVLGFATIVDIVTFVNGIPHSDGLVVVGEEDE